MGVFGKTKSAPSSVQNTPETNMALGCDGCLPSLQTISHPGMVSSEHVHESNWVLLVRKETTKMNLKGGGAVLA